MSVVPLTNNEAILKWAAACDGNNETRDSPEFFIKNVSGAFFIRLTYCDFIYPGLRFIRSIFYDVTVIKKNPKPLKVFIKLCVEDEEKSQKLYYWTETCKFSSITIESSNPPSHVQIICTIKFLDTDLDIEENLNNLSTVDGTKFFIWDEDFSDVAIVINGQKLPAHKFILAQQSPVFEKMLKTDMKEAMENRIVIDDVNIDVMRKVLKFLYNGDGSLFLEEDLETKFELLKISDKYEINTLKTACQIVLSRCITVENVLRIITNATLYNNSVLIRYAKNFMIENRQLIKDKDEFNEIFATSPAWLKGFFEDLIDLEEYI